MNKQMFTPQDLRNVLAGRSAAGNARLALPLSFPRCGRIRHELERLILRLGCKMRSSDPDFTLGDDQKTLLIAKIAFWLVATQSASVAGIRERCAFLDQLAEATLAVPEWMFCCGVARALTLVKPDRDRNSIFHIESDDAPSICWRGKASVLIEMRTAAHLIEQGFLAQNCLGSCYDGPLFGDQSGALVERPPAKLRYLRLIESGDCRIFALRDLAGRSLATIEYQTRLGYISNLEFTQASGLARIDRLLDVFKGFRAVGLPLQIAAHGNSRLIARCVRFRAPSADFNAPARSQATLSVPPDIAPGMLAQVLTYPNVMVDLTALPQSRYSELPATIAAHLYSEGPVWPAKLRVVLGSAQFPNVVSGNFQQLSFCGDSLRLPLLDDGYFRNLRAVRGHIVMSLLRRAAFPRLEFVGGGSDFGETPPCAYPAMHHKQGAILPFHLQRELDHLTGIDGQPQLGQRKDQQLELSVAS